jgi:septum site-determining protein MinD
MTLPSGRITEERMRAMVSNACMWFDYVLLDCPAGIGSGFRLAVCGAQEALVVTTTDTTALRDAQMTVSRLRSYHIPVHLVVNRVNKKLMRKLQTNIDDAMDTVGLPLIGVIPDDPKVPESNGQGQLVIDRQFSAAAKAYRNISSRLTGRKTPLMRI